MPFVLRSVFYVPLFPVTLLVAGIICLPGESVRAALIAYDPFNQSPGLSISGSESTSPGVWPTGGQTWGNVAGTAGISSGSLDVPVGVVQVPTNGNRATVLNSTGSQVAAFRDFGTTFSTTPGSGDDLWFSFLYRPAERTGGVGINEGVSLFEGGTEKIFFGADGNGDLVIRALGGESSSFSDQFANTFLDATSNQTFLVVTNVRGTTDYSIWVDPSGFDQLLGVPTGGTTASLTSNLSDFDFDRVRLGDDTSSIAQGAAAFDEFRMGTAASDVVPEAVPEPAALLLALFGLAVLPRKRRR